VDAIFSLNQLPARPDVILLARGGGSIEDLWAFNDERVVRAVAESKTPIICGVGHETDFTLSDFAADLRAPTPTAAAELATSVTIIDLSETLKSYQVNLSSFIISFINDRKSEIDNLISGLKFFSPSRRIQIERQRLDEFAHRALAAQVHRLALEASQLEGFDKRLEALSPLQVLARGYAVVTRQADGAIVHEVAQARGGIKVRVSDGEFDAEVKNKN